MEIEIKDILYIVGIVVSALVSFLVTRYKLKECIRDKNDNLKEKINEIELESKNQKAKDNLQRQVIDKIGKQMNDLEYNRLLELKNLIRNGKANEDEKKEYITLLFKNGNIIKEQYDKFLKNQNSDEIINAALTIGGVLIATWLLSKLFSND